VAKQKEGGSNNSTFLRESKSADGRSARILINSQSLNNMNSIPEKCPENNRVWERMNDNIETFKKVKEMRANPEKFDLYDRYDSSTG